MQALGLNWLAGCSDEVRKPGRGQRGGSYCRSAFGVLSTPLSIVWKLNVEVIPLCDLLAELYYF